MPFVASGSYGCVFRPHLKCKDKAVYKDGVGKVFEDENEFNKEFTIQMMLKDLDPQQKFTLPILGSCITNSKPRKSDMIDNCMLMDLDKKKEYNQIIMQYGGKSLDDVILNKPISYALFSKLFGIYEPLFHGLVILKNKQIVHQDIKPDNIMYHKGQLYLIDFGIMSKFDELYKNNNGILRADYPYFPPEYKLFSLKHKSADHFISKFLNNFIYTIFIGGKPVNIPSLVESILQIDYDKELKELYDAKPKTSELKTMCSKIDTYQLGITLFMMFVSARLHKIVQKRTTNKTKVISEIKDLIKNMIHPNPYKRYDISKALEHYKRIKDIM